ncbi:recombinase family protein [Photobacterium profundum]|nr:recombinase family protein [Photobacterium profundum]
MTKELRAAVEAVKTMTDNKVVLSEVEEVLKLKAHAKLHARTGFLLEVLTDSDYNDNEWVVTKADGCMVSIEENFAQVQELTAEQNVEVEAMLESCGRVFGYVRISDGNRQESKTQLNSIEEYVVNAGMTMDSVVTEAVSGSKTQMEDRALSGLLNQMQAGDHLVITEVSRLGRSRPMQIMGLLDELAHDRGITVHLTYSDAAIDKSTIEDPAIFFQIVGAGFVAQQEAKRRSERATAAHARRKAEGKSSGRQEKAVIKSWLDGHEWLIDTRIQQHGNNISDASRDLSNELMKNGKPIPHTTLRSALSRWLKRREKLKAQCLRNYIAQTTDCTTMVELLQAKQRKGELVE